MHDWDPGVVRGTGKHRSAWGRSGVYVTMKRTRPITTIRAPMRLADDDLSTVAGGLELQRFPPNPMHSVYPIVSSVRGNNGNNQKGGRYLGMTP